MFGGNRGQVAPEREEGAIKIPQGQNQTEERWKRRHASTQASCLSQALSGSSCSGSSESTWTVVDLH